MKGFMAMVFLIAVLLAMFATARGVNSLLDARAYAKREATYQAARDAALRRELTARRAARAARVRQETAPARMMAVRVWWVVGGVAGAGLLLAAAVALGRFTVRYGGAQARRAELRSAMVYPDAQTGLFPLMFDNPDAPRFLVDVNTGGVWRLTERMEPNTQMIASRGQVQVAGVLARSAVRPVDTATMAEAAAAVILNGDNAEV